MTINKPSADTSHLYDGKTVRSSAPSRKKAAGQVGSGSDIPQDAIPTVEIPTFIESLLGGPLVPKMKFLPPDKMVQNLQIAVYGVLVALAFLTYIISPPQGTMWYIMTGSLGFANIMQLVVIAAATVLGLWGPSSETLVCRLAVTCSSFSPSFGLPRPKPPFPTTSLGCRTVPRCSPFWWWFIPSCSSCISS
jgi:hypothetical protein